MDSKEMEDVSNQGEPAGLGGWLMLFIVGLIYGIISHVPLAAKLDRIDVHSAFAVVGAVSIVATLAGSLIALILVFSLSRFCPKFVVSWLIFLILTNIAAVAILKSEAGDHVAIKLALAASMVKSVAWLLYFLTSKRVKNTFARPSPPASAKG